MPSREETTIATNAHLLARLVGEICTERRRTRVLNLHARAMSRVSL